MIVDPPQFSLTCRSEGGPATTVEWQRDGITIVDDIDHSSSQIVLDAVDAVYHNVLVVTGRNGGEYKCTVFSRTSISATIHVEGTLLYFETISVYFVTLYIVSSQWGQTQSVWWHFSWIIMPRVLESLGTSLHLRHQLALGL